MNAVCGLQLYNFGQTVSIPFLQKNGNHHHFMKKLNKIMYWITYIMFIRY